MRRRCVGLACGHAFGMAQAMRDRCLRCRCQCQCLFAAAAVQQCLFPERVVLEIPVRQHGGRDA